MPRFDAVNLPETIMKKIESLVKGLIVYGLMLALANSLAAQTPSQSTAKVVRIKGSARYSTGNNVYLPLKVGATIKPGMLIQTAANSYVDIVVGEGEVAPIRTTMGAGQSYQPTAEQNVVRIWENSVLGIDKLTSTDTGTDVVTETQLNLQAGRIFGNVRKMPAASKYEVKIPNGVAGIRGTIYTLSADGVVKVLVGQVVLAYAAPDGTIVTQVVMGGQQFDARTGQITAIPNYDRKEMVKAMMTLLARSIWSAKNSSDSTAPPSAIST